MAKLPYFPFYPADFLADKNVIVMTGAEIGAYILLICACWREDGLSNDIEELAAIARMPAKDFEISWEKRIKRCFVFSDKNKKYFHPKLDKELKKIRQLIRQKSNAGKASAAKRKKIKQDTASTPVEHALNSVATESQRNSTIQNQNQSQIKKEEKNTHIASACAIFPLKDFLAAFPDCPMTPAGAGMIQAEVKDTEIDRAAWTETIRIYTGNHDRATNKYLPEKVGNVISVFKAEKIKLERHNGTNQRSFGNGNKQTSAEFIEDTKQWYADNFPGEAHSDISVDQQIPDA